MTGERVLIALGGNAMTGPDGSAGPEAQRAAVEEAMEQVAGLVAAGLRVALTHGNGPQVGNLLIKNQLAAAVVPPVPLDWCVAQTQGSIGVLILDALERALAARGLRETRVAALVTRTLVDPGDPAFADPAKPVGRYYGAAEARRFMAGGQTWREYGSRGWRRVVASPEPREILDAPAVRALLGAGFVVVAAGGGGVPVARGPGGALRGVEAVIDKDLAAALLAREVGASTLVIATDVEHAVVGFGTADARPLGRTSPGEIRGFREHFGPGSMGPKAEAAARFAEGGGRAVITALRRLGEAVHGQVGTIVEGGSYARSG
ncbi:carbamate kinase [Bailinhaonella thermotolerans]|uniref:Carbamate kinase n=1 Tax=Bailinhaonella thermotolerans TaxID=1070861 RepID=A0A3A4AQF3_9ACTN|nr:carbamate kinase [Bailinhaonella thermotolerans]RJL31291.1 carbamate kinase [Bailinhaonella thermotolerans]